MQIDYALILSAGLGTRMGEIGKITPKVLWPVYFKTLLELQIRYCQELGIKKIYINTHFLHDAIFDFLKSENLLESVILLREDPLLDSGGAIHNLAARNEVNYQGTLLLVNGDQFLFFAEKLWREAIGHVQKNRAVLFGIQVNKESAYNETITVNGKLTEIVKNVKKDHDYITYSGLGILNLKGLKPVPGISRFFESVADFKSEAVEMLPVGDFEYWDFGTADIYARNIFKLKKEVSFGCQMSRFMAKHGALLGDESLFLDLNLMSIDLDCKGQFERESIQSKGIFQKI